LPEVNAILDVVSGALLIQTNIFINKLVTCFIASKANQCLKQGKFNEFTLYFSGF
jgi:hypothetical protein